MTALARLQRDFMDALYAEGGDASAGMAIYRGNLLASLHDALAAAYPVVRRLVGEAFFREAARRFALAHPSAAGDLHDYGRGFPAFLEGYPHAHSLDYLGDVARLEWACHESGQAADAAPFDFDALARLGAQPPGGIRFALHPSVSLLRSTHPVAAIWEANQAGRDGAIASDAPAGGVVAWRERDETRVMPLEPREFELVDSLARGAAFGEAAAPYDDAAGDALARFLARLVERGIIAGFLPAAGA